MIKFTKEEISLCKQVAEKHRKEIRKYSWWYDDSEKDLHICLVDGLLPAHERIPLWTISDCLEWLEMECVPLKMQIRSDSYARLQGWKWRVSWGNPSVEEGKPWGGSINTKTLLEACLKAVLAVLVEGA